VGERQPNYFFLYVKFLWGVVWRTFAVAIAAAIVIGMFINYLKLSEGMGPDGAYQLATWSGMPVAIISLTYVFFRRGFEFKKQIMPV